MAFSGYRRRYTPRRRTYRRSYGSYSRPSYRRRAPARRRAPVRRRKSSSSSTMMNSQSMTPGQKFVLAQADPFETKCFGAKIPDSSTIPSVSTPIQYNQSLTTAAATQPAWAAAWAFYPAVYQSFLTPLGATASTWSWATTVASDAPVASKFGSAFEAFRPVAHAIRLSCPFAPTSTTGFVHVALATETIYSAANTTGVQYANLAADIASMSGYTFYKRVTLASLTQTPLTIINKWTDETAFRYSSPYAYASTGAVSNTNSANTFQVPLSWGTLLVAVEGVSTSTTPAQITPLQAEIILHTESIPDKSGTLIGSTAAAYSSSTLNAVSQAVAGTDFSHTEDQQDTYMESFAREVQAAAGNAGIDLNGLASSIGRRVVNAGVNAAVSALSGRIGVGGVNNLANRLMIE